MQTNSTPTTYFKSIQWCLVLQRLKRYYKIKYIPEAKNFCFGYGSDTKAWKSSSAVHQSSIAYSVEHIQLCF